MVHKPRRNHDTLAEVEVLHPVEAGLETLVASLLATSGSVDASGVTVTALGRRIRLAGYVHSIEEIERCTEIALSLNGVEAVDNDIGLQRGEETSDPV
ncbi:osmotically-inducible protein OsmY [Rhizobium aquaticum]|uniref:Osmotically-inducible protein OsmY n=1 Tax=Rhizobium aquaticum TaxID=1549636 RepID=A0ABV2J2N1_9HYPH